MVGGRSMPVLIQPHPEVGDPFRLISSSLPKGLLRPAGSSARLLNRPLDGATRHPELRLPNAETEVVRLVSTDKRNWEGPRRPRPDALVLMKMWKLISIFGVLTPLEGRVLTLSDVRVLTLSEISE